MVYFKKKLLVVLLLFSFIIFFASSSVNASGMSDITYTIDQATLLKEQQEYLASIFLKKALLVNDTTFLTEIDEQFQNAQYWYLFSYSPASSNTYINCYRIPIGVKYENLTNMLVDTNDSYFEDAYFDYPISGYSLNANDIGVTAIRRYRVSTNSTACQAANISTAIFIPSPLIMYQNETVKNYINGVSPNSSGLSLILQAIASNTEQEEETTDEMKKLNDFMSSENVDQDAYDMPTQNDTTDATGQRT